MHKIIKIIRYIMTIILTFLIVNFTIKNYSSFRLHEMLFIGFYILYIILSIKDIIRKNDIVNNTKYNILQICFMFILTFVYARALYDSSIIVNNSKYDILLNQVDKVESFYLNYSAIYYFMQNTNYFIGLIILLLIYRKMNMCYQESKYNVITISTLIISVLSIVHTIDNFGHDTLGYLLFTLILIGIEIYFLIKDNHKKREWPIYVSWIFNLMALMSIAISFL